LLVNITFSIIIIFYFFVLYYTMDHENWVSDYSQ
jgi:hypothetical protein